MPKRKNIACMLRRAPGKLKDSAPNAYIWRDQKTDRVHIAWYETKEHAGDHIGGLRSIDARMLSRRLKQFLEAGG